MLSAKHQQVRSQYESLFQNSEQFSPRVSGVSYKSLGALSLSLYIYIYIYVCVCVCVCVLYMCMCVCAWVLACVCVCVSVDLCTCSVIWSCLSFCDPMDCNLPGSSVHGIFQGGILEWVAISSSRRSFPPRD